MTQALKDPKIINYVILLYAFSIPLSLELIRALAIAIIILWVMQPDFKSKVASIKQNRFFVSIGILLLILSVSLLWTDGENIKFGVKYITRYWYILPMFAIYTSMDKKYIPLALSAFLAGMLVSELVSYGIFFNFIHIKGTADTDPSPFMHHTLYSVFLVFTMGILLNQMITSGSLKHNIVYGIFFTTITANLFINSGRTGQFLFLFIFVSILFRQYKLNLKSLVLSITLLIAIPSLAFLFSPNFKTRMIETYHTVNTISYTTSIGSRIGLNIAAKDIFLQHPIVGVGVGDYLSEKDKIVQQNYPERTYVKELVHYHNQFAEFAVIAGIFGLFSYLFIFISLIRTPIKNNIMNTIKYILVSVIAIASLSDAMFHLNRPLSLFALFAGLLLAQYRHEQTDAPKSI